MAELNSKISRTILFWGSLFLISGAIGLWFRTYPLRIFVSDPSYNMASILMMNRLIQTFEKNIRLQSQEMDDESIRMLAVQQANGQIAKESAQARGTIINLARQMDAQNPQAQKFPFLLGSDPFLYYDLTKNIAETGRMAEVRKGSKYLNPKMNYPLGHWEPFSLHPYVGYAIDRCLALFTNDTDLMYSVSWTPIVLSALSLIVFLMLCGRLSLSYWATLSSAVFFMTAPIFIRRSMFGWYDNDPYNVLFPLILLYILVRWLTINRLRPLQTTLALGLFLCLYSLFWQGWMYMAVIITACIALVAFAELLMKDADFKKALLVLIGMPAVALPAISLIFGPQEFFQLFQEGWTALNDFMTTQKIPLWPDLYIAVGELKRQTPLEVIDDTGGILVIALALWGAFSGLVIAFKKKQFKTFYALTAITLLAAVSFTLSMLALRFILLAVTPLAVLSAVGIHNLIYICRRQLNRYWPDGNTAAVLTPVLCGALAAGLITASLLRQYPKLPSMVHKIYNAAWHASMLDIKTRTPPSSVIYTWWPPGHFIKGIADRAVTFDGASINARQAYWLANVFLQTDERKAVGILRMIHTSANQASQYLLDEGFPLSEAARILKSIVPFNRSQAGQVLKDLHFSDASMEKLLSLTHAQNLAPAYLMVYNELLEKHILLSYTGNWDFAKAEEIRQDPEALKKIPKPGQPDYYEFLWQMSGGKPLCSDLLHQTSRRGNVILLGNEIEIDLATRQCRVNSPRYGQGTPQFIYFQEGNRIIKKPQDNATMTTSLVLGERHGSAIGMLMPQAMAESLLMKLYFFNGAGLNYFSLISQKKDSTLQTQLDTFKVDWEKFLEDISGPRQP